MPARRVPPLLYQTCQRQEEPAWSDAEEEEEDGEEEHERLRGGRGTMVVVALLAGGLRAAMHLLLNRARARAAPSEEEEDEDETEAESDESSEGSETEALEDEEEEEEDPPAGYETLGRAPRRVRVAVVACAGGSVRALVRTAFNAHVHLR